MRNFVIALSFISVVILVSILFTNYDKNTVDIIKTTVQSDCALEKAVCKVFLPGGYELLFDLEPKGLPVMEPLVVKISGLSVLEKPLKIWFEGKDMDMGKHYMLPLLNHDQSTESSLYKGMIPVCSIDNSMVWLLNAEIPYQNQLFQIQFQLRSMLDN